MFRAAPVGTADSEISAEFLRQYEECMHEVHDVNTRGTGWNVLEVPVVSGPEAHTYRDVYVCHKQLLFALSKHASSGVVHGTVKGEMVT